MRIDIRQSPYNNNVKWTNQECCLQQCKPGWTKLILSSCTTCNQTKDDEKFIPSVTAQYINKQEHDHWTTISIIIITYPSTARVVGAPQMISHPVSSILPCSPLPSGTWLTRCPPTSSSLCLVFFPPFTVPCNMVLARPDERETWPYHCSLRLFTMVRSSSCGSIAC